MKKNWVNERNLFFINHRYTDTPLPKRFEEREGCQRKIKVMKYITVDNCKRQIKELDPKLSEEDDGFKAAVIMLYGSLSGFHHVKTLHSKCGYDMEFTKMVARNLRNNGIWASGNTYADWDRDGGAAEFWLHVAVALGFIERAG